MLTLGIETSCDETAAAVYHNKNGLLSSVLFSQIELHKNFGGVVPELASRSQLEKIAPIVKQSLQNASVTIDNIDNIAVTYTPGLPGSLLVGVCFAKTLAWTKQKKLIGVNHLEGHIFSAYIENNVPFEHICLTASGGHTALYLVQNYGQYQLLGETQDDAAGEAFDKIAKLMNLEYPGGPIIEKLASQVDFVDYYHYPRGKPHSLQFSFSGLKTAILYDLIKKNAYDLRTKTFLAHNDIELQRKVASSLLVCTADIFEQKLAYALSLNPHVKAISFVGGVACNNYIKNRLQLFANKKNLLFFSPSRPYCTDNGAMIAFVGNYKAQQSKFADLTLDIK